MWKALTLHEKCGMIVTSAGNLSDEGIICLDFISAWDATWQSGRLYKLFRKSGLCSSYRFLEDSETTQLSLFGV